MTTLTEPAAAGFTTVHTIDRDRFGRPLIKPPGGGKPVPYTRCTTYVDVLEDKYNLQKWMQRMVILGLIDSPELILDASAHRDDKTRLNSIAEQAVEHAKGHAAATVGTAVHRLTEIHDSGGPLPPIPAAYRPDVDAYITATAGMRHLHTERFTVLDELRIGGTPDRVVEYDGHTHIADVKTGNIDYGAGKIAMQLAVYAHSQLYDPQSGARTPIDGVDLDRAIIIHLPAGTGRCELHWVDIAAGWETVALAGQVRDWRARKDLTEPINVPAAIGNLTAAGLIDDPITAAIDAALTVDELTAVWEAHRDVWTDAHTAHAATRKQAITA